VSEIVVRITYRELKNTTRRHLKQEDVDLAFEALRSALKAPG
jgi:hypothetical protein